MSVAVPAVEERRRRIEAEALPPNIGALLDAAADEVPDRLAWNFFESGETVTYQALRAQVHRLANGMARAGIRKGSHVGVMLPNVAALPTTWLALARLGAVMVPMNIAYTPREMTYVIEDGDVEWLIVHEECLKSLAGLSPWPGRLADDRIFVVGGADGGLRRWDLPKKMFDNILNAIDPTIAAVSVLQVILVTIVLVVVSRFGAGAPSQTGNVLEEPPEVMRRRTKTT